LKSKVIPAILVDRLIISVLSTDLEGVFRANGEMWEQQEGVKGMCRHDQTC
jgi:hypothetical protein